MTHLSSQFIDALDKERRAKGISQSELGRRIGKSHATVNYYFSGGIKFDLDTAKELADAIGVDFIGLLTGSAAHVQTTPRQALAVLSDLVELAEKVPPSILEKLRTANKSQLAHIEEFFRIEEEAEREVEAERAQKKRHRKDRA